MRFPKAIVMKNLLGGEDETALVELAQSFLPCPNGWPSGTYKTKLSFDKSKPKSPWLGA